MTSPGRLRILMTTDAVGGVWTYSVILARGLAARGAEVLLVTLGPEPRPRQVHSIRPLAGVELVVTNYALEWMDPQGDDAARARHGLLALARQWRPDLVHVNGYREALADWMLPIVVVAHSCVRSWWLTSRDEEPPEPCWRIYAAKVAAGLIAADRWIAPTEAYRQQIERLYPLRQRGQVIANGYDAGPSASTAKQPFILAAGRLWDEAKNVGMLLSAAPETPWPIRLAGATNMLDASTPLPPNVSVLGELDRADLLQEMQRAAIYVAPAVYEPFGLSVLEAAAAGCALVLSDIPTFRELWSDAAIFVAPRDVRALAETLTRLAHDPARLAHLQRAAAERARRYDATRMIDCYQTLYSSLLDSSRLRRCLRPTDVAESPA